MAKKLGRIKIQEGMIKKGGLNPKPSSPRPPVPPKGQAPLSSNKAPKK